MMSEKQKRFHSSPPGPDQMAPSLSTPSTSIATARIVCRPTLADCCGTMRLDRGAHATELLDNRDLALIDTLDPVSSRLFPESDIAHQPRNAVGLKGSGMIGAPHRAIHRDMPLDRAG